MANKLSYENLEHKLKKLEKDAICRKHIEETLRKSGRFLQDIFESIEDGIYIINQQYDIQYVNPVLIKDFGYYEGRKCYEYFHDRNEVCPWCKSQEVFDGKTVRWEWHSFKNERTYDMLDTPMTLPDGSTGKLEIFRDITERKQMEVDLRESEEKYRRLVKNLPSIVFTGHKDWSVEFFDNKIESLTGYNVDEFNSKKIKWIDIIIKEDIKIARESFIKALKADRAYVREYRIRSKAGNTHWIQERGYIVCNDKGEIEYVSGLFIDITNHKIAEEAMCLNESRLETLIELNRMTESPMKQITDFVLESAVKLTNSKIGYLAFINEDETVLTMHSWSKETMEQCKIIDKPIIYPVETTGLWGETVRQRKPIITNDYSAPNPFKKGYPKSHIKINRHMNIPVFDNKRIVAVAGVGNKVEEYNKSDVRQLTLLMQGMWKLIQRKRTDEEKSKLEAQLQQAQKMEAIGTLSSGIAHDFNNILSCVSGYTELALDITEKGTPLYNNLQEVFSAAMRATDLIKQILTFNRQTDQKLKPLNVQLIIREALKLIISILPSTIKIKHNISNKCGLVMADASQIHQVAMNLLTNAFHAMEDEGGKLDVTLKEVALDMDDLKDPAMVPGQYVCLTVSDTGTGIDESLIDRIFDPYFSTKGKHKGTGLGLSTVYGIVKSHGGNISVHSEPGKGTEFHVYLPVIQTRAETKKTRVISPVEMGTEQILFVDDEEQIARMLQQILEGLGYHVTARTSSVEALETFRAAPDKFDLVITDTTMPNMTGVELAKKLMEIRSDIPIIICTGFSEKISEDKAKAMGIRGFLMKPIVRDQIAGKIRKLLDER